VPFTRAPIAAYIVTSFITSGKVQGSQGGFSFHQQPGQQGDVFDAEYEDKTQSNRDSNSNNRLN
jgi:UPF0716 family protein affecting phage T7 exclusion